MMVQNYASVISVVLNLFWPIEHLSKDYPMDHVASLTSQEQIVETVLYIGQ